MPRHHNGNNKSVLKCFTGGKQPVSGPNNSHTDSTNTALPIHCRHCSRCWRQLRARQKSLVLIELLSLWRRQSQRHCTRSLPWRKKGNDIASSWGRGYSRKSDLGRPLWWQYIRYAKFWARQLVLHSKEAANSKYRNEFGVCKGKTTHSDHGTVNKENGKMMLKRRAKGKTQNRMLRVHVKA